MQRSVTKRLQTSLGIRTPDPTRSVNVEAGTGANLNGAVSVAGGGGFTTAQTGGFGIGFTGGSVQFGILLEALEQKGLVRTLSEPNLTALSGQEAAFLAGGEYPIPVASENNTVTVEYKPFGVELTFKPVVVDDDIINLSINAAVSSIDTTIQTSVGTGITLNAFKRREAQTTVEMRDGESFAIAGLLQDDFTDSNGQIPWLGDVPVLGALFRSADFQRNQSELVIIITPHLVSPTRGEALALPTDRVKAPTEAELFLFGKTASTGKSKGAIGEVSKQDYSGSYGYVME
jgi:pilus assembly protein CpaC